MINTNYAFTAKAFQGLVPFKGKDWKDEQGIRRRITHELELDEIHVAAIRSGDKKSTIRFGLNFIDNDIIKIKPYKSAPFDVRFKGTEIITYADLTDEMAKNDGLKSLKELQELLHKYYGEIADDYPLTIIHWEKI